MTRPASRSERVRRFLAARPGLTGLACGGVLTFLSYILVFFATRGGQPAWINLTSGLINAASLTVLAAAVIAVVRLQVIARSAALQAFAHAGLAFVFTYAWYLAVIILNGIRGGSLLEGFEVNPFNSPALTWQLFQGLALYAVAAMGAYVLHYREALAEARERAERRPDRASVSGTDAQPSARRVMVRGADGFISLDFDEVLYVRATRDGASFITRTARHETRKTLTALSALLPEGRFVRAHRSILVNREAILSAEPAGDGRLTLHLPAGESLTTSRAGARAVRAAALL